MSKFGEAFKAARKSGKKNFSFGGKSYTTKTKEEAAPPVPKDRPKKSKAPVNVKLPDSGKKNPKSRVDTGQKAAVTKLKGKVKDLPSKKRQAAARVADAKNKSESVAQETRRKSANQYNTNVKRKKALGN